MKLSRARLQRFLYSCFHTEDDFLLDRMTSLSKENAQHMWRMPNDVAHPRRMNNAMYNFIVEILLGEKGTLTFAEANKRYSQHCLLLKKYMQDGDHHTAMLLYQALTSPILSLVQFRLPKSRQKVLKDCKERYGTTNDAFSHHLDDVVNNRLDYNEIASLMVCLIHKKKLQQYRKIVKKTSNVENQLLKRFQCYEPAASYDQWMDIYIQQPQQHIQNKLKETLNGSTSAKLFTLAKRIRRRKTI